MITMRVRCLQPILLVLVVILLDAEIVLGTLECSNPPPGVAKMVRGVDITSLDLIPLKIVQSSGFKNPIINFTCNQNRSWISPQSTEYQLPDQIWHMNSVPGGWLSADVKILKTSSEVRKSMTNSVGGEGSIFKFAFSASGSYRKMQNTIANSSSVILDVSAFESVSRVDFFPNWVLTLDRYAEMFIDQMITGTYRSNPEQYNRFIATFGTHYMATANFGGYIRTFTETNSRYFYSKTEREVKANAKASFLKIISAHGGHVSGSTTVSSEYRSQTSTQIKYYGGNTNLLQTDGIQRWQPTVDKDPWLFSGAIKPISDIIRDQTKKDGMKEAVLNYVMKRYLDELSRLVATAKSKTSSSVLVSLESRINVMKTKDFLTESAVEALGNDVKYQLVVPSWFRQNTKLCYKWRPDGDGGQCGGGAARLLCASPNSMTSRYRDDTDDRGGGCRMQWGIITSNFPSWFQSVKVCYRWYADGDGGQCGGGAAKTLCSSLNAYSPEYRDDSDERGGGCRMSWRIVVPSSAPLWMKTAKMCYSWYPDGDGGQCGPAPSRNLCAVANQWTAYYRDDTDERGGGCMMKWGIMMAL